MLIELELPNGSAIEAIGRVAWTKRVLSPDGRDRDAGIGIQFMGGVTEQFDELADFIDTQGDA